MEEFDLWMENNGYSFVRFADDINVYVDEIKNGYSIYNNIEKKLLEYGLEVNNEKKGIVSAFSTSYLGYQFEKKGDRVLVKRQKRNPKTIWPRWHMESVEKANQEYHLINDGILTRKDFSILFQNQDKKVHIPVEVTDSISIYSNTELNSNFLDVLSRYKINLNVYNRYGIYLGSFYSNNQRNRMKCMLQQAVIYQNPKKRLEYAKKIDSASLHNLRCNLKYYQKHHASVKLEENIKQLSENICEMKKCESVEKILLIEARARQKYYKCFNEMINGNDFIFSKRTKRPPQDAINALISFGNTWLYRKIAQMIYKTSVDIRISLVHSSMKRNENLNLDIADIFKPIIVDRVICTLINKRMLLAEQHFQNWGKGVFLNNDGKKIFLQELEYKMQKSITLAGEKHSYEQIIFGEIRKLERSFLSSKKYKPFKYQI